MRICKSVSHCSLRLGILRKNLSYLHIKQHPLWLHISFFTYFNQPLTNHNIAAVTRVWYKKSSHTVRVIPQRPSVRSNSILFCLLSEQIKNDLFTKIWFNYVTSLNYCVIKCDFRPVVQNNNVRNPVHCYIPVHFLFLQLLKIERVSETGVKQTCISDVNFAPLVAMPDSDSSLPKLFFPKENPKRREKVCWNASIC